MQKIKNWIRDINHQRIDFGKELILRLVTFLFDRPRGQSDLSATGSPRISTKLDPSKVKKILIFHFDDKIGDMVVNTILFRELKNLFPQSETFIVTGKNSENLIRNHSQINKCYVFTRGVFPTILLALKLRKIEFDLVIDMRAFTDARTIFVVNMIHSAYVIGFSKKNYRAYNESFEDSFDTVHSRERARILLEHLGAKNIDLKYNLELAPEIFQKVRTLLENSTESQSPAKRQSHSESHRIIINAFSAARFRSLTDETLKKVIELTTKQFPNHRIHLIAPPEQHLRIQKLVKSFSSSQRQSFSESLTGSSPQFSTQSLPGEGLQFHDQISTISEISALISMSELVISVDTSILHIASAFNIPVIGLYRDEGDQPEKNSIKWAPVSTQSFVIKGYGKTDGYLDVNTFSMEELTSALKQLRLG